MRPYSQILIAIVVIGLCLYDVFPYLSAEKGDTLSEVIAQTSSHWWAAPFVFGVLAGHWFWPDRLAPPVKLLNVAALVGIPIAINAGMLWVSIPLPLPAIAFAAAGTVCGHLFWPLRPVDWGSR